MENHEHIIYVRLGAEEGGGENENQREGGEEEKENPIIRCEFKQFDIILKADDDKSINDHYYRQQTKKYSSKTNKRIMKEWKILEESLPDSIYVRAYEGRIDLLRAVIIGASGTPYHDGLFFFDIQFPSDYPNQPPKVFYRSFGFSLNPNLCQSGFVCLSLLNKSSSGQNHGWNPSESTILQLLVSIQGLILTAKPYFNVYNNRDLSANWFFGKRSLTYNEEVFLYSCKLMLAVLNRPPSHFKEFVTQHFRDRAETILVACKAYVGDHPKDNTGTSLFSSSTAITCKTQFYRNWMRIIYSKLVQAFTHNGSSLENVVGDTTYLNMVGSDSIMNDHSPMNANEVFGKLMCFYLPLFSVFLILILIMSFTDVFSTY